MGRWPPLPWLTRAATILALISLAACGAPEGRDPNDFERVYTVLALEFEEHRYCAKISPQARILASFNSSGTLLYYARSQCFMYLALRTQNAALCRQVRELDHFWYSGDYFSPQHCRSQIAAGVVFRANLGWPSSVSHEMVLRAIGYGEDDLRRRFPDREPAGAWFDFFHDFRRRGDGTLQQRLLGLPDFAAATSTR